MTGKLLWLRTVSLLSWGLLLASAGWAQGTGARLEGIVTDESKAVIPGASVSVMDTDTSIRHAARSDSRGRYIFPDLTPGHYEMEAVMPGFKTTQLRGITLTVASQVSMDITLSVGDVAEQVTVTSDAPLVETRSAAVSGVVDERAIQQLPLNGRSFSNLIQLEAGVVLTRAAGRGTTGGTGEKLSISGARPMQMSFLLDGADLIFKDGTTPAGVSGIMMGVDTIQEFRVSTSGFSAEYGRTAGGVVSAITKSGTNELHGSAYEFLRNDNLDSRNFFDVPTKPEFKRNQFGFTLGGPLRRDRTFFFGSYEGLREALGITRVETVPTEDARRGQLPNNRTVTVAETMKPYLAFYPLPNGADLGGGIGRYFWGDSDNSTQNNFLLRLDHQISSNDSLMGRVFFDQGERNTPGSFALVDTVSRSRIQSYVANYKKLLGSVAVNDFRLIFTRSKELIFSDVQEELNRLGFIPGRGFGSLLPGGLSTISTSSNPRYMTQNLFEYVDDALVTVGAHNFKFGGIVKRVRYNGVSVNRDFGEYQFNNLETLLTATPNRFVASLFSAGPRGMRQWLYGIYLQDDYRVSPRLTLNLGVRYEAISSPTEVNGRIANLRRQLDKEVTVGNPYFLNPSLKNFAPRFGFAYDPHGNGRMSVRGGFGIYFDQLLTVYYRSGPFRILPFYQEAVLTTSDVPRIPFPDAYRLLTPGAKLSDTNAQIDLSNWNPSQPYMMQYNLTVQRQVSPDLSVLVGFLGSQSRHNTRNVNWNTSLPTGIVNGDKFWAPNAPRRNPSFGQVLQREMDSNGNYNSLQFQAKKRYSHGLDFNLVYQFSRTMDEQSGIGGSTDFTNITSFAMDPEDRGRDYSRAAFDIHQYLTLGGTYSLGTGPRGSVAEKLLGGWKLSSLLSLSSGEPFTVVNRFDQAGNQTRIFGFQERPNLKAGRDNNPVVGNPDRWFDPSAFEVQPAGFLGNLGRNTVQGPGVVLWDMAILKEFTVSESRHMEFRWELFNILNRANFGTPDFNVFLSPTSVNPSAGRITNTRTSSRQMQFALKFVF